MRGHVIPVIELHNRFGLSKPSPTKVSLMLVVDVVGRTFGLLIDRLREMLRPLKSVIEPPSANMPGSKSGFIGSIAKIENELLYLLDEIR